MKSILLCILYLNQSKYATSFRSPLVYSFSAINRSKTLRCASSININSKIAEVEAELKELKSAVRYATGEEELLLHKRIIIKEQQMTLWIESLPGKN